MTLNFKLVSDLTIAFEISDLIGSICLYSITVAELWEEGTGQVYQALTKGIPLSFLWLQSGGDWEFRRNIFHLNYLHRGGWFFYHIPVQRFKFWAACLCVWLLLSSFMFLFYFYCLPTCNCLVTLFVLWLWQIYIQLYTWIAFLLTFLLPEFCFIIKDNSSQNLRSQINICWRIHYKL